MSFVIEGREQSGLGRVIGDAFKEAVMDTILDSVPPGLDQVAAQRFIDAAILRHALSEITGPKKLDTARRHLLSMWPMIAPLAVRSPADFDAILLEYAERSTVG